MARHSTLATTSEPSLKPSPIRAPFGVHYGWIIIAILAVVQVVGSSISMAAGIMVPPLNDPEGEFGWSMGLIGAAIATYYLVGALFAPVSGWMGDRFGGRRMMLMAGSLYAVSMVLLGFVTHVWHFFLFFGLMLALTQSMAMVPLMAAASGWFHRRLGVGLGILWGAGGIGTAIVAPLIGYLIENVGWQATFWTIGIVGGGTILLLTPVFRNKPSDVGLLPYGALRNQPPPPARDRVMEALRLRVFNQHMRRTRAFWNLPLIHGMGCAGHGIVLVYSIPIAVERGVSLVDAAVILTLISLVSIPSRIITPILAERYGPKQVMTASLLIQGLTVFMLFWAQDLWAFYLFAALFGVGFGGEWTGYLVINRQYFGNGPMGSCYGWQMSGALLGHAFVTVVAGLVIYVTGSYVPVLILSIAGSMAGVLLILALEPTGRMLIPNWEESLPPEARFLSPGAARG